MLFLQPCRDQLSDIEHLHGAFRPFFGGFLSDHAHTERTTGGDGLGPCLLQLAITVGAHSLSSFFSSLPKRAAPGAAAKAIGAASIRLGQVGTRRPDQRARLIEDAV